MRDTRGRTISKNDRVVLTSDRYGTSRSNPLQGTSYACEGTYIGGSSVKWDNGTTNTYGDESLTLVTDCVSIWD